MTTNDYANSISTGLMEEAQFLNSAKFRKPIASEKYLDVEPWYVCVAYGGGYSVTRLVCLRNGGCVCPEFRRPLSRRQSAFTLLGAKRIANKLNTV